MIVTTTDNRQQQYGCPNRKYLYLWNFDKMALKFQQQILCFQACELTKASPDDSVNDQQREVISPSKSDLLIDLVTLNTVNM